MLPGYRSEFASAKSVLCARLECVVRGQHDAVNGPHLSGPFSLLQSYFLLPWAVILSAAALLIPHRWLHVQPGQACNLQDLLRDVKA